MMRVSVAEGLAERRLEELQTIQEEKTALVKEVHCLTADLERRRMGLLPDKDVAASALYRALAAGLEQVVLRKVRLEEDAEREAEERAAAEKDATDALAAARAAGDREADEARRLVEDLRRVAESAKAEKDKWIMTYEARKMEANAAAGLVEACERRAAVCEGMRDKLKTANEALTKEVAALRARVVEGELRAVGGADASDLVSDTLFCLFFSFPFRPQGRRLDELRFADTTNYYGAVGACAVRGLRAADRGMARCRQPSVLIAAVLEIGWSGNYSCPAVCLT